MNWDYADVFGGPWRVGYEPRRGGMIAIKSGAFTILTVGDYFDGGGPLAERLEFICAIVNTYIAERSPGGASTAPKNGGPGRENEVGVDEE